MYTVVLGRKMIQIYMIAQIDRNNLGYHEVFEIYQKSYTGCYGNPKINKYRYFLPKSVAMDFYFISVYHKHQ